MLTRLPVNTHALAMLLLAMLPLVGLTQQTAAPPSAAPSAAITTEASEVVRDLQDTLIELMRQGQDVDPLDRERILGALISRTHDLAQIARIAVGRDWDALEPAQREQFLATFHELSVASYGSRFGSYAGERFEPGAETTLARGDRQVDSTLVTGSGARHSFAYVLRDGGDGWRIVNIIVDGVSDLALKRAEYRKLLQQGGFDGLIAELERQIARLRAPTNTAAS